MRSWTITLSAGYRITPLPQRALELSWHSTSWQCEALEREYRRACAITLAYQSTSRSIDHAVPAAAKHDCTPLRQTRFHHEGSRNVDAIWRTRERGGTRGVQVPSGTHLHDLEIAQVLAYTRFLAGCERSSMQE